MGFDDETEILRSVVGAQAMIREKWGDNEQIRHVFEGARAGARRAGALGAALSARRGEARAPGW